MSLYYLQTNIICLVLLLVVGLMMQNERGGLPAIRVTFSRILIVAAALCISDIFAWLCNGMSFAGCSFVLQLSNMIYDAAITVACYMWLNYVKLRTRGLEEYSREKRRISAIPMMLMMLIVLINPITGFLFTIDGNNVYARGDGIIIHWIISWGYLVWATVIVVKAIRNAESKVQKKQYIPLLWFIIPPAVAALCQMFFYGMTSMQCGITVSLVIISFGAMMEEVSRDSLTTLNNRNAFENYTVEHLTRHDCDLTLIMCDVDKFKTINDTMGHVVGDLVLKRMADILKEACSGSRANLFLCRYGGDEFVICGTDVSDADISALKESIRKSLLEVNAEYADKINLGLSIGTARAHCENYRDIEQLIRAADNAMYSEKRSN